MPSPIAHLAVGYAIYNIFQFILPEQNNKTSSGLELPLTIGVLSLLPDVDSAAGLLTGNFGRYHNNASHSFFIGFVVASIVGAFSSWKRWLPFWTSFLVAAVAYHAHILMDVLNSGRGVMAFWPLSKNRYSPMITLFYGLHWSDGLFSRRHLVTILTESVFAFTIIAPIFFVLRRGTSKNQVRN